MNEAQTPHQRMQALEPSWKPHTCPAWLESDLLFEGDKYFGHRLFDEPFAAVPGVNYEVVMASKNRSAALAPGFFDHWGSVQRGPFEALVTQPYGDFARHLETAKQFVHGLRCVLFRAEPTAPWAPGASYFEFHPSWGAKVLADGASVSREELMRLVNGR